MTSDGSEILDRLKRANSRLALLRWLVGDFEAPAMPDYVCFNVTAQCNLKCPHCPVHGTPEAKLVHNDPAKNMSRSLLARLAAETLPYAETFNLTLTGETLVIQDLDGVLAELGPYQARLELTTNGTRLTARNVERLLPVARHIQLSCEAGTERVFEQLRLGARFADFVRNAKLLTRTGEKVAELHQPSFGLTSVAMGSNLPELPQLVRLAHFLGMRVLRVDRIAVSFPWQADEDLDRHRGRYNYWAAQAKDLGARLGVAVHLFQQPFEGVAADSTPTAGTRLIVRAPLSDDEYAALPALERYVDLAAIEAESDAIAERIRAGSSAAAAQPAPAWWGQEAQRLEAQLAQLLRRHAPALRALAAEPERLQLFCVHLQGRGFTRFDGALLPCCAVDDVELGSVREGAFGVAWNGAARRELIERFRGEEPPDFCAHCPQRQRVPVGLLLRRAFPEGLETVLAQLRI